MISENISLQAYNTFNINATAKHFSAVTSTVDIQNVLQHQIFKENKHYILGGGSNVLLKDNFNGLIIHNQIKGIRQIGASDEHVWLEFGAGEVWHDCVLHCIENNLGGIENLSLIPGFIGAAPMQNIGAYGVELEAVFHHLDAVELSTGKIHTFYKSDCEFGYRDSIFKKQLKDQFMITNVVLRLDRKHQFNTSYGAIADTLEKKGIQDLNIKAISDAVIEIRQSKLPDPKEIGNAGSFFKNPVVDNSVAASIAEKYEGMPSYPAGNQTKIPAGWLIDKCGWKGKVVGNTGTYKNQALVIVNHGGASGDEIYALSEEIRQSVIEQFGIELEREVNLVG